MERLSIKPTSAFPSYGRMHPSIPHPTISVPAMTISSSSSSSPGSSSSSGSRKKARLGSRSPAQTKWRTGAQERIYGRKLIEALHSTRGAREVKEAADSALALTAKGQSRWSRAILAGRCRRRKLLIKAGGKVRRRRRPRPPPGKAPVVPTALKGGKVRERLRALGRLVPGCRRLPAPSLLDEAADYVAALEMQVKAMRALADALSATTLAAAPLANDAAAAEPEPEN